MKEDDYKEHFRAQDEMLVMRRVRIEELENIVLNQGGEIAVLKARIAELEQELHYAKQAARAEADMCDQARAGMKQLREALKEAAFIAKTFVDGYEDLANSVGVFEAEKASIKTARKRLKALEQTK